MAARREIFIKWVHETIFPHTEGALGLSSIMIWPFSPQEPQYREIYSKYVLQHVYNRVTILNGDRLTPHVNWHWDVDFAGPLAGLPMIISPSITLP